MSTAKELKKEIERGVWDASLGRLYGRRAGVPVSYTHLRAHETRHDLVCRLLLEKKKKRKKKQRKIETRRHPEAIIQKVHRDRTHVQLNMEPY